MMAVFTGARQYEEADSHHKRIQKATESKAGPNDVLHGQAADEVVGIDLHAHFVGNEHHRQERYSAR